jgi:methylmalonyl-CoA mutase C-terminal domain/subunit
MRFRMADEGGSASPVRVMLAKVGLDGHDRGVKVVARVLRDAGMEVIYTGLHRKPEEVLAAALQEDVDVLGVSILSGAHFPIFTRIFALINERPGDYRFAVLAGGVIPDEDVLTLKELGVSAVVGQETTPEVLIATVRSVASGEPVQIH